MTRSAAYGAVLATVALAGCAVLANRALCCNPPASGDPVQDSKTHATIAAKATNVLQGYGKGSVAAFYTTDDHPNLVKGTREADVGGDSRLRAVSYRIPGRALDWPDQADFYAYLTIDGRQFETGVVDGCDDMRPNSFIPCAWGFPKWMPAGKSSIQIKIAVWDDDAVTGDDKAHICPKKNEQELWVNYDLNTGRVTGDASANASGLKTAVHAKGNHSSGDEAEIWFTVERLP